MFWLRIVLATLWLLVVPADAVAALYPVLEKALHSQQQNAATEWEEDLLDADEPVEFDTQAERESAQALHDLREAVIRGRWPDADGAVDVLLRVAEHAGEKTEFAQLLELAPFVIPLPALDVALEWASARLLPKLPDGDRQVLALLLMEQKLNRSLMAGNPGAARQQLAAWQTALSDVCALEEAGAASDCESARKRWQEVNAALSGADRSSTMAPALPLTSAPLIVDHSRYRCGMAWMGEAMRPISALRQPDAINVAAALGDLDHAIALALADRELGERIDPRLPDLLLARYGKPALRDAFANAERAIHERPLMGGRVVVTTLFGLELKLPSERWERSDTPDGERIVTVFDQPAQHVRNLRASALYKALFDPVW